MNNKILFFVLMAFAVLSLSKVRFLDDYVMPGNDLEIFTSVVNSGSDDIDDVRVIAYFPELGETSRSNNFDVQDNDNYGNLMWWNVPTTVTPGDYLVRISATSDEHKTHKYRYITVE